MNTVGAFDDQVAGLLSTAARTVGMIAIEPELATLLSTMECAAPAAKADIIQRLLFLIHRRDDHLRLAQPGILELLEYTMHKLRWTEVRLALLSIDTPGNDLRERQLARRVLDAYNDDWSNADIYDAYRTDE